MVKIEEKRKVKDVDIVTYLGGGEYHVVFITNSELDNENEVFTVNEPSCIFCKEDAFNAYEITTKYNKPLCLSEFRTLDEAIKYASDNILGVNDIIDVDIKSAIKLIGNKQNKAIVYSQYLK